MKRFVIITVILSSIAIACNKAVEPITQKTISVDQPGLLSSLLTEDEILTLTELTISGSLNGTDIRVLRNMAKNCCLSFLDLKDASIMVGGNAYLIESDGISYHTNEDDISTRMFSSCNKLKSIVLPKTLKNIGEEAFYNCSKLSSIKWFEGLDSIGDQAFYHSGLSGEMVLPKSLRTIGRRAFFDNNIQKVTIQSDIIVPSYESYYAIGGNSSFANCKQLKEIIINEGCTKLEVGFQGCETLSSVILPSTLTHLGANSSQSCNYIFKYCENLRSISLPNGLQLIGIECFSHSGITEIELPESVQEIKKWAFANTPLTTMKVNWDCPLAVNRNIFNETNLDEASLYVPSGTLQHYKSHVTWSLFGNILEEPNLAYR